LRRRAAWDERDGGDGSKRGRNALGRGECGRPITHARSQAAAGDRAPRRLPARIRRVPARGLAGGRREAAGWNGTSAPAFAQSFEPGSLGEMRSRGLRCRMLQLVDGDAIDLKTGKIACARPFGRPLRLG